MRTDQLTALNKGDNGNCLLQRDVRATSDATNDRRNECQQGDAGGEVGKQCSLSWYVASMLTKGVQVFTLSGLCVCDLKCRCAIGNAASVTGDVCIVAAVTSTLQLVRSWCNGGASNVYPPPEQPPPTPFPITHAHSLRYLTNQCQLSFASPASVVLRGVCDVVLSHWRAAVAWLRHNATKIGQAAPSPLQDVRVPQVPLTCRTRAKQYGPTPNPTSAGQKQGFYNKTHSPFTSSICRLDFCRGHVRCTCTQLLTQLLCDTLGAC